MNGFEEILDAAAKGAEKYGPVEGDYISPQGLLICGKCHTPKQCRVTYGTRERVVGCMCRCAQQRREEERKEQEALRMEMLKARRKKSAIQSSMLRNASFEGAQSTPTLEKARNYVKNWKMALENNIGLLLMGDVGVGKSFAAACVCNALLDQGYRCYMTSFVAVSNMEWNDRARFLSQVGEYDLLVLDDLGAQRDTESGRETVFSLVDERYRSRKPLIVTTNLGIENLRNPPNLDMRRGYDRLLEICGPIHCQGESFRAKGRRMSGIVRKECAC